MYFINNRLNTIKQMTQWVDLLNITKTSLLNTRFNHFHILSRILNVMRIADNNITNLKKKDVELVHLVKYYPYCR